MPLGTIPPWLNIGPTDYLHAIQAGTQAGLEVNRQRALAEEAAARRDLAQQEAQRQAWEFGETMRQQAAQRAIENELKRQALEQSGQYQSGMLDWHNEQARLANEKALQQAENQNALMGMRGENLALAHARLEQTQRYQDELNRLRQEAADRRTYPTEYETISEKVPELLKATPAIPAKPFEKKSLFGIDWLWRDQQATPAVPAMAPHGEQTITRRIPLKASAALETQPLDTGPIEVPSEGTEEEFQPEDTFEVAPAVADRVSGRIYLTPKGQYRWTGSGWVKP